MGPLATTQVKMYPSQSAISIYQNLFLSDTRIYSTCCVPGVGA